MRMAYLCPDRGIPVLGTKGASVHVRAITEALQRRGHEVIIVAARLGAGNPPPAVSQVTELSPAANEATMEGILRAFAPDVVIERYSLESGPARRATLRLGIAHVLEVNAPIVLEASRYRGLGDVPAALERERWSFGTADAIAAVSSQLVDYVRSVSPHSHVERIPNGVDADALGTGPIMDLGLPAGAVAIGFAGSMKPWHGVHELLNAFAAVADDNWHLVMAGAGPEEGALMARVGDEGALRGRVHLLGALAHENIGPLLRALDVGVAPYVPSTDFYFSPLKVLEYLAAGLPVVFPDLGDLLEVVGGGGLSYAADDSGALAGALAHLVDDDALRRRLARPAKRKALRWSWAETARRIEALAERALSTRVP